MNKSINPSTLNLSSKTLDKTSTKKGIHFIRKNNQYELSTYNFLSTLSFYVIFLFFCSAIVAQKNKVNDTIPQVNKIIKQELLLKKKTLKGTVYLIEDKIPLPGASIVIQNSTKGTESDFDGNFELTNIKEGDILAIYYLGYETQNIVFQNQLFLEIFMQEDQDELIACYFTGDINTKATYKAKRSFWQRIKSIF